MIATQVASPFLNAILKPQCLPPCFWLCLLCCINYGPLQPLVYTKKEKRFAVPLLASSMALFYLGTMFAYVVVFPLMFSFFTSAAPAGVSVMTDISSYLDFVLVLFFAFGVAFEVPIATVILVWSGANLDRDVRKKPCLCFFRRLHCGHVDYAPRCDFTNLIGCSCLLAL